MRQDDRVTTTTITLPAGYKYTSVEEALKAAHDQEYELRMAFFWECQRLEAKVESLYRHGDLMLKFAAANMSYPAYATMAKDWLAVKEARNDG